MLVSRIICHFIYSRIIVKKKNIKILKGSTGVCSGCLSKVNHSNKDFMEFLYYYEFEIDYVNHCIEIDFERRFDVILFI